MISVVIPLYNKAHTIVRTLGTVLAQTYRDFEVVIVNDGSTDNGVDVIMTNFNDTRIRIINQSNAGVSAARNRGVEEARGEWIAFIDGDDEWHPEYLDIMMSAIRKYPDISFCSSGGLIEDARNGSIFYRVANRYINEITQVEYFENPDVFSHTSSTIVNKEAFRVAGGFPLDMQCLEDFSLFYNLALVGKFVFVGLPISKYVGGVPGQITSAGPEERYKMLVNHDKLYNRTFITWQKSKSQNKTYIRHIKYKIRHTIKVFLTNSDSRSLNFLISNMDNSVKRIFLPGEFTLYLSKHIKFGIIGINLSKLIWRIYQYPRIGEKINTTKLPKRFLQW